MPRYLISFDAHAMDHIPGEDMPAVTDASLAVGPLEAIDGTPVVDLKPVLARAR